MHPPVPAAGAGAAAGCGSAPGAVTVASGCPSVMRQVPAWRIFMVRLRAQPVGDQQLGDEQQEPAQKLPDLTATVLCHAVQPPLRVQPDRCRHVGEVTEAPVPATRRASPRREKFHPPSGPREPGAPVPASLFQHSAGMKRAGIPAVKGEPLVITGAKRDGTRSREACCGRCSWRTVVDFDASPVRGPVRRSRHSRPLVRRRRQGAGSFPGCEPGSGPPAPAGVPFRGCGRPEPVRPARWGELVKYGWWCQRTSYDVREAG